MGGYVMVGCDVHQETLRLRIAEDSTSSERRRVKNTPEGRTKMIEELKGRAEAAGGASIWVVYEAGAFGFGLHDDLTEAGLTCRVLAPSLIPRSSKHKKNKNDDRDAERLLGVLRSHLLAGEDLPDIWTPDAQTRGDRQLVRLRLEVGDKLTRCKSQVQSLLKFNDLRRPSGAGKAWTKGYRKWLRWLVEDEASGLGGSVRKTLEALLRQVEFFEEQKKELEREVCELAETGRYEEPVRELVKFKGVGTLTAMVFLTEMGDLSRFSNRRQVASYLGLTPTSNESGDNSNRKGHITRQGPGRVRKVLCQATWAALGHDPKVRADFDRMVRRNPKRKNVATVAFMRRLGIRLWHRGLEAQQRVDAFGTGPPVEEGADVTVDSTGGAD